MFIPFPPSEIRILGMENITIPKLYRIRQDYTDNALEHPERELEQVLSRILTGKNLRRKRIAVTAGSRGVPGYAALLREICRTLRAFGAQPFVVPAMGSHGGATADGQRQLLAGYGIREETIGAPIESSMQTVQYGKLGDVPLLCDKLALRRLERRLRDLGASHEIRILGIEGVESVPHGREILEGGHAQEHVEIRGRTRAIHGRGAYVEPIL